MVLVFTGLQGELLRKGSMKAALITMHRVGNYGSALQTVATTKVLNKCGIDVKIIDYWRPDQINPAKWASEHSRFVRGPITKALQRASSIEYFKRFTSVFPPYIESNLRLTRQYTSIDQLRSDPPLADLYIVGSDQVWNTDYNIGGTEPYLLEFGSQTTPRISLASSIGKHPLNSADLELLDKGLSGFAWLSVREATAKDDLSDLGFDIEVLPDPTLLISPAEWRKFAGKPIRQEPFVLLYTLNRGTSIRTKARTISKELKLPLVTLNARPLPWIRHRREYRVPSVNSFLNLLVTASHVVTDSFHATAFSLNLGTPVSVLMPPKYSTRLESILNETGTHSRSFTDSSYTIRMQSNLSSFAMMRLKEDRVKANERLQDVLRLIKGHSAV